MTQTIELDIVWLSGDFKKCYNFIFYIFTKVSGCSSANRSPNYCKAYAYVATRLQLANCVMPQRQEMCLLPSSLGGKPLCTISMFDANCIPYCENGTLPGLDEDSRKELEWNQKGCLTSSGILFNLSNVLDLAIFYFELLSDMRHMYLNIRNHPN